MTTGARISDSCASASCAGDRQGAETRHRPGRPLRERLHAGEATAFWGPAGAGDRDGTSVAERRARGRFARGGSVAGARVAQILTGVAMAPVPPVGGDGYGRG